MKMDWKVTGYGSDSISLVLNFTNPHAISTSTYEPDTFSVNILPEKKASFIVVERNRPIRWTDEPQELTLK